MKRLHCDFLVVGGGLFGSYAALYLARKGLKVVLLEKEERLFSKASLVNQARLHSGYHYPRSIATALMSNDYKERFAREHRDFILFELEKYYAIDRYGSYTDAVQFERFCDYLNLHCEPLSRHWLFSFERLEALYRTTEPSFDPVLIGAYYKQRLKDDKRIEVFTSAYPLSVEQKSGDWEVRVRVSDEEMLVLAPAVLNATYSATNAVHDLFGVSHLSLMHEISEIALLHVPGLDKIGLTVMDGPFGSIMPFGKSGLHSLSSVAYTHHRVSYEALPIFSCQTIRPHCLPERPDDCNVCPVRPSSNYEKMARQMRSYFKDPPHWQHLFSLFTIKSKLQAHFIDDGRPTEILSLRENPAFYCIFAGKINSIYEIEKVL